MIFIVIPEGLYISIWNSGGQGGGRSVHGIPWARGLGAFRNFQTHGGVKNRCRPWVGYGYFLELPNAKQITFRLELHLTAEQNENPTEGDCIKLAVNVSENEQDKCFNHWTYQWIKDGSAFNIDQNLNENKNELDITSCTAADSGTYTCRITCEEHDQDSYKDSDKLVVRVSPGHGRRKYTKSMLNM